jgi:hypothetical protein
MPTWALVFVAIALAYVGLWWLILQSIAYLSGWKRLALLFPAQGSPPAHAFRWQHISFGAINYSGCITLGVSAEGLYVAVVRLFSTGHVPLQIPWSALRVVQVHEGWMLRWATLEIDAGKPIKLRIPGRVLDEAQVFLGPMAESEKD